MLFLCCIVIEVHHGNSGTLPEFPVEWKNKLTVLRAYLLTCMESAATTEDVFSVKLAQYRKEFAEVYRAAQAAALAASETTPSSGLLTIPIERA